MATITINGLSIADPQVYKITKFYRESSVVMADGSIRRDQLSTSQKFKFTMQWSALTNIQKNDIQTAFGYVRDSSTVFTDHAGASFTVVRAEEMEELEFEIVPAASGFVWSSSTFVLIEV